MMETRGITLIQPRHIYAPDALVEKYGHVYLPTSLLTVAAIFQAANIHTQFIDENLKKEPIENEIIGFNLLGAPYIPVVLSHIERIRSSGNSSPILIGGQVVNGLTTNEIKSIFGTNVYNGNDFKLIETLFPSLERPFLSPEKISLVKAYDRIPPHDFKQYLSSEISFYLSQGCKFSCTFCAAMRSGYENYSGTTRRIKESYRNNQEVSLDLKYLFEKCNEFGLSSISLYLSNLDVFQSPSELSRFADSVIHLKRDFPELEVRMRGLATVRSFLNLHRKDPDLISKMRSVGLYQIGFGIDGATYEVYKLTKKPQTTEDCLRAIKILKNEYGIIPETLMVFGHNRKEDENALEEAYNFSLEMMEQFDAVPRPHVAKDVVPGNDGWHDSKNRQVLEEYIQNPWLFQNMDFTALPSQLTHPDIEFRELVEKVFIKMCELPNSLTQYVFPFSKQPTAKQIKFNTRKYDI